MRYLHYAEKFQRTDPEKILFIRLEDLVNNNVSEMNRIGSFLSIEIDTRRLQKRADSVEKLYMPDETWKRDVAKELSNEIVNGLGHDTLSDVEKIHIYQKLGGQFRKYHYDIKPLKTRKVLIVTHIKFWERDFGSRMRLYSLLEYLKTKVSIKVLFIPKSSQRDRNKLQKIGYEYIIEFLDDYEASDIKMDALDDFLDVHPVMEMFFDELVYKKFYTFIKREHFDVAIIEYIQFSYLLPLISNMDLFLDTHDIMSIRNRIFKEHNKKHWISIWGQSKNFGCRWLSNPAPIWRTPQSIESDPIDRHDNERETFGVLRFATDRTGNRRSVASLQGGPLDLRPDRQPGIEGSH